MCADNTPCWRPQRKRQSVPRRGHERCLVEAASVTSPSCFLSLRPSLCGVYCTICHHSKVWEDCPQLPGPRGQHRATYHWVSVEKNTLMHILPFQPLALQSLLYLPSWLFPLWFWLTSVSELCSRSHHCSVSRSVMSDSLRPHGLQHARLTCPKSSPGVCSHSCLLSPWCHPEVEAGFRKGRGTRDQIANICWVIGKAREFQKHIYFLLYWVS